MNKVLPSLVYSFSPLCAQVQFPKFYHAMEMWSVKMATGGNPPFVAELAMRKVSYDDSCSL